MKVTILSLDLYGFNKFIANELQNKGIEATYINSAAFKHVYKNFGEKIINFFSKTILKKNLKKNKQDRKSTRLNSSHVKISYAVFCLKKKTININNRI